MPTCKMCGTNWGWLETFCKILTFRWKKKCPYCGHTQYITYKSSQRMAWPALLILLLYIILPSAGVANKYTTAIALLVLITGFLSNPFLTRLSNTQEHPWNS